MTATTTATTTARAAAGTEEYLHDLVTRAINGDRVAHQEATSLAANDSEAGELISHVALVAARHEHKQKEELQQEMTEKIMPAMVRSSWQDAGSVVADIEMQGQRHYARIAPTAGDIDLRAGEEVVVTMLEGGPPLITRTLNRQFETAGRLGTVVDIRRLDDGQHELEVEVNHETWTCRATAVVIDQIEEGEIDALGGLPIRALHGRGFVWDLRQENTTGKQIESELRETTLDDFAGYSVLRNEITLMVAQHVLSHEPALLRRASKIPDNQLKLTAQGVFASGLPGTGKTYLMLAVIGSLRHTIGAPKARAKLAAIRLWAATHPDSPLYERAGEPEVDEALGELNDAIADQYEGLRSFGLPVETPRLDDSSDLARLADDLLEGYRIGHARLAGKLLDLEKIVAARASDFMVLTLNKEDYIQPLVGAGLNNLSAQLKRAEKHDDVSILLMPEAEVLLARRGHNSRFYTDELVSKLLESLAGLVDTRLFVMADGNRVDMVDNAVLGRRLKSMRFHGLQDEDRLAVIEAIISRDGQGDLEILREKLLDLTYSSTDPICELVMADQSTVPLSADKVLTPAMIQNVVRSASSAALQARRVEVLPEDMEVAWRQELVDQSNRFSELEIADLLGLDGQQKSRIQDVRRTA